MREMTKYETEQVSGGWVMIVVRVAIFFATIKEAH